METQNERRESPSKEIRTLLLAAMAIFVITVVIGILNGLDLLEFDRFTILTHVHAGTLGWMTLGFFAACFWLFGREDGSGRQTVRWLTWVSILTTAAYVVAFYTTLGIGRVITGTLMFLSILAVFGWTIARAREGRLTIPKLAMLAALTNLVIGAVFGILISMAISGTITWLPTGTFLAHPAAMLVGYIILAGMAIAEWQLKSQATMVRDSRWGIAQVGLPFIGAIFAMIGALLDFFPLLALNVPLEVIGVIIFLVRLSPELRRQNWLAGTSGRMFSLSAIFVAVNIGLLSYLIITYAEDFELTPPWLIFAMDHAIFIGMMTNGLFGLVYEASHEERSFWSWVDHLLFWGMNIGMVGFVVGLIQQSANIKRIFTPIMGVSILVAIVTYAIRLYRPIRKQGRRVKNSE